MASPNDRRYAKTHEWHKIQDDVVTLGLTQFAVDELTDITYVEITAEGQIAAGDALGEIESVKATSGIYTSIAGKIVGVNQEVLDDPSKMNADPFEQAWLVKIQVDDPIAIEALLTADQYDQANS